MGRDNNKNVGDTVSNEETVDERGKWGNPMEFILSSLGYAVGLGNVWRFPYLCYENGGGAFLIPYAVMLTFVGLPVFFLELAGGQFSGYGPFKAFGAISPLFQGVGLGMVIISFIGCIYYNMVIAWSLYYLFATFQKVLPWSHCDNDFNTETCYAVDEAKPCEEDDGIWLNRTCFNSTFLDSFATSCSSDEQFCVNGTINLYKEQLINESATVSSAAEEYFNLGMLDRSDRIEDTEYIKWDLCLVLLLAWVLCFLCVIKGIKSSGKVVYFTATFPYLVLVILFFRGVTLDGASKGIDFYIKPDWDLLMKPKVWADAAGQIFFSLSVGLGGLMTFSSYNKFHNNIYRDTLIVTIGNCLTSFFAGFVIFSIIGYMAHTLGKEVKDVVDSGSGLAFVAYPTVVSLLPVSHLWAILFFFMLLTLGLDSQFAGIENIQTAIIDSFPRLRKYKVLVALMLCIILFLLGLPMCTRSGLYWTDLMGYYSSGWSLVLVALAEVLVFGWVYGAGKIQADIELMIGFEMGPHWWFCWRFISPILLIAILIFNLIDFTPLSFGDYVMPTWAQVLGWGMALVSVAAIAFMFVYRVVKARSDPHYDGMTTSQMIVELAKPSDEWRPSDEKDSNSFSKTNGADIEMPPDYAKATGLPEADSGRESNGKYHHSNPAYDMEQADTKF